MAARITTSLQQLRQLAPRMGDASPDDRDNLEFRWQAAASAIWNFVLAPMRSAARYVLSHAPHLKVDIDDPVNSAFCEYFSWFRRCRSSALPKNRDELKEDVRRAAATHAKRYYRRQLRERTNSDESINAYMAPSWTPEEHDAQLKEFAALAERLREVLPEKRRLVLELGLRGLSNGQIAAEMKLSVRTIERRWERIREEAQNLRSVSDAE
jgi:RNA polymerase sigma factor (sigma-70 family)